MKTTFKCFKKIYGKSIGQKSTKTERFIIIYFYYTPILHKTLLLLLIENIDFSGLLNYWKNVRTLCIWCGNYVKSTEIND